MASNWAVGDALGELNGKGQGAWILGNLVVCVLGIFGQKGPFEVNR